MYACNRSAFQPSFGDHDEFPRKYLKQKNNHPTDPPPRLPGRVCFVGISRVSGSQSSSALD